LEDEKLLEINQSRFEKSLATSKKITLSEAADYVEDFIKDNQIYGRGGDVMSGGKLRVRQPATPPRPIKLRNDAPDYVRFAADTIHFNLASPNRHRYLMIETNAPNGYRLPEIEFVGEGDRFLKYEVIAKLHQGRFRIRVDIAGGQDGYIGEAFVRYNKTVQSSIGYEFTNQKVTRTPKAIIKGTGTQTGVPKVTCVEVNPNDTNWTGTLKLTGHDVEIFAFRPVRNGDALFVYWNNEFPAYANAMAVMPSETEREHVKYHLESGLMIQALYSGRDGVAFAPPTPEVEASRCAALASTVAVAKGLLKAAKTTKKRRGAAAGQ